MKKIINGVILVLTVLMCNQTFGQNNMEDVVYLKNGSIYRGLIIEQIPNQSIKIESKDRNVYMLKFDEIEKISKENLPTTNSVFSPNTYTIFSPRVNDLKKRGFINITEISSCPGLGNVKFGYLDYDIYQEFSAKNIDNSIGLRTINGLQLNENFSVGIGVGIDKYKSATLIPITLDARATLLKGRVSPTFSACFGYSLNVKDLKGGVIFNPQIGIKTYITKNMAYLFNIGCKWQAKQLVVVNHSYTGAKLETINVFFRFLTISTGFAF